MTKIINRYYGSDLNLFIDQACTREMSCINIDCLLVKISKRQIRFIEYKHSCETIPKSQLSALKILQYLINKKDETQWKVQFYIVRGDPPFDHTEIQEVNNPVIYVLNKKELIKWLNFEEELKN